MGLELTNKEKKLLKEVLSEEEKERDLNDELLLNLIDVESTQKHILNLIRDKKVNLADLLFEIRRGEPKDFPYKGLKQYNKKMGLEYGQDYMLSKKEFKLLKEVFYHEED